MSLAGIANGALGPAEDVLQLTFVNAARCARPLWFYSVLPVTTPNSDVML